jgi:hypothetical protein
MAEQLSIDGIGKFSDRLKALAKKYGPIQHIGSFVDWAVQRGLGNGMDLGVLCRAGLILYVRQQMKAKKNGLREWICTGTAWIHRENCTDEEHQLFCRLLKKKRDQVDQMLQLELAFHIDRWNREVVLEGSIEVSSEVDEIEVSEEPDEDDEDLFS